MMDYEICEPAVRTIAVSDYVARFRDVDRFEGLCRGCPNYGTRWGCPPLDYGSMPPFARWTLVDIWLLKLVVKGGAGATMDDLKEVLQRERRRWEPALLEREREHGGMAALFTGMCPHCGDIPCARLAGEPCRHPDRVRPSLEALGFDLGKTAAELFGLPLQWMKDGRLPDYLTLIGGVFY